jgi:hypothetical protein
MSSCNFSSYTALSGPIASQQRAHGENAATKLPTDGSVVIYGYTLKAFTWTLRLAPLVAQNLSNEIMVDELSVGLSSRLVNDKSDERRNRAMTPGLKSELWGAVVCCAPIFPQDL